MVNQLLAWYEMKRFWQQICHDKRPTLNHMDFASWQLGYVLGVQTTTNKVALVLAELRDHNPDVSDAVKLILQWAKDEVCYNIACLENEKITKLAPRLS